MAPTTDERNAQVIKRLRERRLEFAFLSDAGCVAYAAMLVIRDDPKIGRWLEENDPQAYSQLCDAILNLETDAERRYYKSLDDLRQLLTLPVPEGK